VTHRNHGRSAPCAAFVPDRAEATATRQRLSPLVRPESPFEVCRRGQLPVQDPCILQSATRSLRRAGGHGGDAEAPGQAGRVQGEHDPTLDCSLFEPVYRGADPVERYPELAQRRGTVEPDRDGGPRGPKCRGLVDDDDLMAVGS
jgi:hypothetical protein